MVQPYQVEQSLQQTINALREKLARRNMAFGALFIGMKSDDNQPEGNLIVMADFMPAEIRIQVLTELIDSAQKTIEHYRRVS